MPDDMIAFRKLYEEFKHERSQIYDVSEDHFLLLSVSKKVDILGVVLLGNGTPESSIKYQVHDLLAWRASIEKILWATLIPTLLAVLGFAALLLTGRAAIMFK